MLHLVNNLNSYIRKKLIVIIFTIWNTIIIINKIGEHLNEFNNE